MPSTTYAGYPRDLTGQRFGRLTVISVSHKAGNRQIIWKTQCDCGEYRLMRLDQFAAVDNPACWNCHKIHRARERILSDSYVNDRGCWEWFGSKHHHGYADMSLDVSGKRIRLGHVIAYLIFIGEVPEGKELDHVCRFKACVNPWHLEPVTHAENVRRGITWRTEFSSSRKACAPPEIAPFQNHPNPYPGIRTGPGSAC